MTIALGYLTLAGAVALLVLGIAREIRLATPITVRTPQFRGVRFTTTAKE